LVFDEKTLLQGNLPDSGLLFLGIDIGASVPV